jgi:hypothetical protein
MSSPHSVSAPRKLDARPLVDALREVGQRTPVRTRPRTTILGHDWRSRCRGQAGVPVSADETTAWDEEQQRGLVLS